jgi:NDP-sugar pyrophosphorylase family protein
MKAIILAAGKGERLSEITQTIPKPMINFRGKPILQYNIELCKKYGIEDIYINLHHLPEIITDFFGDGKKFGVDIKYSYEEELLGTAGAVKKIANKFWNTNTTKSQSHKVSQSQSPFYVIYGDQISSFNLDRLKEKYNEHDHEDSLIGVVAFHYRKDVVHSGVAEFDNKKKILRFIEKPQPGETKSHWVNAGVYLLSSEVIEFISEGFSDFGRQVFPSLLERNQSLYGVCKRKDVSVFDTPELYARTKSKE